MRNFSMGTIFGLFAVLAGSASASPGITRMDGTFTAVTPALSTPGIISVGDPFYIDLSWDDAQPNLIAPPDYHATNVGTLASFLIVDVPGFVDDVFVSGGTWTSHMRLDLTATLTGVYIPMTVTITGTGNTPGQILPDFKTISSSLVDLDLTPLAAYIAIEGPTQAVITSITNTFPPHDTDGDGVLDNVDNCKYEPNADQKDSGGVAPTDATPDGIGDACQCGDANGDGKVSTTDATILKRRDLGFTPPAAFSLRKCNVNATGSNTSCTTGDATLIVRRSLGFTDAGFSKTNCPAALP